MKHLRAVKSYVRRQAGITRGQKRALETLWPKYGLELSAGMIDFTKIFRPGAPKIVEIGFGMGHGLLEIAKNSPECDFIGIEVHGPGIGALLAALEQHNITNVRIYNADANEVLAQCIPDEFLDRIQIYFPDPWPKKRHHKRRLIQTAFVELIYRKLNAKGDLHLATDWKEYAMHMLQVISSIPELSNLAGEKQFVSRPSYRPLTKFEKRGQELGHIIWDLIFKKK